MSYFGRIMVQFVATKLEPYGDVLGTLCIGWVQFKTPLLKSDLGEYSDAYIVVKGRIIQVR